MGMKFYGKRPGSSYGSSFILRVQDESGEKTDFTIDNSTGRVIDSGGGSLKPVAPNNRDNYGTFLYKAQGQGQMGGGAAVFLMDTSAKKWNRAAVYSADGTTLIEDLNSFYSGGDSIAEGGGGGGGGYAPGQAGQFGFFPADLTNKFPKPSLSKYTPMETAPYRFTDPQEFAAKYGTFNRGEIRKNYDLANELALKELDTELEGLKAFVPAASALKRSEISLDNVFNQAERTKQVDQALPGVRGQLEGQAARAEAFASGHIPDELMDRAYDMGARSDAADRMSAGGFGASSSVARKTSDLMSAAQRIQLSQYGDQLLTSNIGVKANLLMAPTQYSDAGAQIKVMPSISGSQLAAQALGDINQQTLISAQNAFTGTVQQDQYATNLEQNTRQFNTTNALQNEQFNTTTKNSFKLTKFQYMVGYAGAVAGAYQTNKNTEVAFAQQAMSSQIYQDFLEQAQQSNQAGAIAGGVAAFAGFFDAISSLISGLFGDKKKQPESSGTGSSGTSTAPAGTENTGTGDGTASGSGTPVETPSTPIPESPGVSTPNPPAETPNVEVPEPTPVDTENTPYDPTGEQPPVPDSNTSGENAPMAEGDSFAMAQARNTRTIQSAEAPPVRQGQVSRDEAQFNENVITDASVTLNTAGVAIQPSRGGNNSADMARGSRQAPAPGMMFSGYDTNGNEVWLSPQLSQSQDGTSGAAMVNTVHNSVMATGAMNDKDSQSFKQVGDVAQDPEFRRKLDNAKKNNDKDAFVNTMIMGLGRPLIQGATYKNPDEPGISAEEKASRISNNAAVSASFTAFQLFRNWDRMSAAQKSLGIASLGVQTWTSATGEKLSQMSIIEAGPTGPGGVPGTPGLNVGQAMTLLHAGVNVYTMIDNWDTMSDMSKIMAGSRTVADMAILAKQFKLLGTGQTGAAISQAAVAQTNNMIANGTAVAAPELGVGAIKVVEGTALPDGYSVVSVKDGTTVAVPTSNFNTAINALQFVGGALSFAQGAKTVYDSWGKGGASGRAGGAIGGSSMAAGLYAMGSSSFMAGSSLAPLMTNPYTLAAVVAVSVIGSTIKTGKHKDQYARDAVRGKIIKPFNIMNDDDTMTLADGSKADLSIDGRGGMHDPANPDKLVKGQKLTRGQLNSYDVDYTNDLDYTASMGSISLVRILAGGTSKSVEQIGGQLANASISNIGYGQEMTEANFNKMRDNQRAMYSKAGITDKASAYQLANQAFAEGRLDAAQYVSATQSFDIIFDDDGYQRASGLMTGRWKGVEIAGEKVDTPEESDTKAPPPSRAETAPPAKPTNRPPVKVPNREQMQRQTSQVENLKTASSLPRTREMSRAKIYRRPGPKLTKEEIRVLNQQRYAQRGAA